ncbi:MAG TPA: hypothetical protein VIY51_19655 [Xanthobacteraceae bacterium]
MALMSEDWETLDRKINYRWITSFFMVILGLLHPTRLHSSATWTVRQKSTGLVRRVTADSESEAADKIAKGWFDADES